MTVRVELNGDSIMFGYLATDPNFKLPTDTAFGVNVVRPSVVIDDKSACGLRLRQLVAGYQTPNPGTPAGGFPKGPQPPFAQIDHHAQVVVVGVGVNDAFDLSISAAQFRQDLHEVIDVIKAQRRAPLICNIVQISPALGTAQQRARCLEFNTIIAEVIAQKDAILVDWFATYLGPQDIQPDGLHRTEAATRRLGEAIGNKIFLFGLPYEP